MYNSLSTSISSFPLPWSTLWQSLSWLYLFSQQEVGKYPVARSVSCFKTRLLWAMFSDHQCWAPISCLSVLRTSSVGSQNCSDCLLLNFHLTCQDSWSTAWFWFWPLISDLSIPNWWPFFSVAWAPNLCQMNEWMNKWPNECQGNISTMETEKWYIIF